MKYYIIAGEASGDLHGANLIKALVEKDADATFRVWGGDKMQAAGGSLAKHYRDLAFMGFAEVVANLRTILGNIRFCKEDIQSFQPDVIIYIDYPGFNLRIAKWAKENGFLNYYYISPQLWAWNEKRVHLIKKIIDKMFVILPFEAAFYEKYNYKVEYVGHPLLDEIATYPTPQNFRSENNLSDQPIIALLPGSRLQEINKLLSIMLQLVDDYPNYQFVIAMAPSMAQDVYTKIVGQKRNVGFVKNRTYDLLLNAHAALVTSGTATLETALFKVPQVVCYKGSSISYHIAKRLVDIKYISLVNLIMDQEVVTELIQHDMNVRNLKMELEAILSGSSRDKMLSSYSLLEERLGGVGASDRVARLVFEETKQV